MANDHFYSSITYTFSEYGLSLDNESQEQYKEKLTLKEGDATFLIDDPLAFTHPFHSSTIPLFIIHGCIFFFCKNKNIWDVI